MASAITECIGEDSGIEIYFGLKNSELRKANFLANTQQLTKNIFIEELQTKIINTDLSVVNFSSADERGGVIYQYDLDFTNYMQIFSSVNNALRVLEGEAWVS